ncbi:MAG: NUDIX hydrolase [Gemmatimonadota bacterium]|nr:MAG: NUDIX hydrolase [Gemmatimonadota bacterium]
MDRVKVLERRWAFEDVFKIEEAIIEHRKHDGSWSPPVRQLCFERGDSVAALLMNRGSGRLVLVNQFRYPTLEKGPGWITEIVAGGVPEGETPEAAIVREVREETGYGVESLEHITTFYVSPGGTSERVLLYYGEVSGEPEIAEGLGVGDEDIKVIEMSPAELWDAFLSGDQQDAKTIIALFWLRLRDVERRR